MEMGMYGISSALSVSAVAPAPGEEESQSAGPAWVVMAAVGAGSGSVHVYTSLDTSDPPPAPAPEHHLPTPPAGPQPPHPARPSDHLPSHILTSGEDSNGSDAYPRDRYGAALAMHQNILAVGAPGDDCRGRCESCGAVYLYDLRAPGNITRSATLYLTADGSGKTVCRTVIVYGLPIE